MFRFADIEKSTVTKLKEAYNVPFNQTFKLVAKCSYKPNSSRVRQPWLNILISANRPMLSSQCVFNAQNFQTPYKVNDNVFLGRGHLYSTQHANRFVFSVENPIHLAADLAPDMNLK